MNASSKKLALLALTCTLTSLILGACTSGPVRRTYTEEETSPPPAPARPHPAQTPAMEAFEEGNPVKRAQTAYANGNYAQALTSLNSVPIADFSPQEKTEYWNLKGLIELARKTPDQAEHSFQNAITVNPNPEFKSYYQYNLASAYADENKNEDAIHVLNLIDSSHMDENDRRKITILKDKLSRPAVPVYAPGVALLPSPSPTPSKAVYSGSANANRIGLLIPLSGKYESFGRKVQHAVELAFQNSPVAKKYEIELIPEDSGESIETEQEAFKKLVEDHQVIAVIGPILSKGLDELNALDDYYQVPLISVAQSEPQGAAAATLFSCSVSPEDQAAKVAEYATEIRGFKRFAILAPSNKGGEALAHAFWDQVSAKGGQVTSFELYQPDVVDFRAPVDKTLGLFYTRTRSKELKDLADKREELKITRKTMKTIQYYELPPIMDFDAVFIADEAKTAGQIIPTFAYRNAKDLNYLGISTWNSTQLLSRAGDQVENSVFPVAFNTLNPPESTKQFFDLYSKTYSTAPGELDATAYDAASAVLEVLKDHPSSWDSFARKLAGLTSFDGATGTLSIKNGHCSRNLALYTVKKGQFETVPGSQK